MENIIVYKRCSIYGRVILVFQKFPQGWSSYSLLFAIYLKHRIYDKYSAIQSWALFIHTRRKGKSSCVRYTYYIQNTGQHMEMGVVLHYKDNRYL